MVKNSEKDQNIVNYNRLVFKTCQGVEFDLLQYLIKSEVLKSQKFVIFRPLNLFKVAPKLKERMMNEGSLMITFQPHKGMPNFWRAIISNPAVRKAWLKKKFPN